MNEQGEHELTATQRAHWRRFVEFHNAEGTGRALFPDDAEIVTAVDARLAWLESERARLIAERDTARSVVAAWRADRDQRLLDIDVEREVDG